MSKENKYKRKFGSGPLYFMADVYDVIKAFGVTNPATAHAVKKLLCAGQRGVKGSVQDLQEAITAIERAIELETE